jgi:hypothetical protein
MAGCILGRQIVASTPLFLRLRALHFFMRREWVILNEYVLLTRFTSQHTSVEDEFETVKDAARSSSDHGLGPIFYRGSRSLLYV